MLDKISRILIKAKVRAEYLIFGTVCGSSPELYKDTYESFVLNAIYTEIIIIKGIGVIHNNRIYIGPSTHIVIYEGIWFDANSGQELETRPTKISNSLHLIKINTGNEILKYKNGYVKMPSLDPQYFGEYMREAGKFIDCPVSINMDLDNVTECEYVLSKTVPANWIFTGAE